MLRRQVWPIAAGAVLGVCLTNVSSAVTNTISEMMIDRTLPVVQTWTETAAEPVVDSERTENATSSLSPAPRIGQIRCRSVFLPRRVLSCHVIPIAVWNGRTGGRTDVWTDGETALVLHNMEPAIDWLADRGAVRKDG